MVDTSNSMYKQLGDEPSQDGNTQSYPRFIESFQTEEGPQIKSKWSLFHPQPNNAPSYFSMQVSTTQQNLDLKNIEFEGLNLLNPQVYNHHFIDQVKTRNPSVAVLQLTQDKRMREINDCFKKLRIFGLSLIAGSAVLWITFMSVMSAMMAEESFQSKVLLKVLYSLAISLWLCAQVTEVWAFYKGKLTYVKGTLYAIALVEVLILVALIFSVSSVKTGYFALVVFTFVSLIVQLYFLLVSRRKIEIIKQHLK